MTSVGQSASHSEHSVGSGRAPLDTDLALGVHLLGRGREGAKCMVTDDAVTAGDGTQCDTPITYPRNAQVEPT